MAKSTEVTKNDGGGELAVISDEFRTRFPALAPDERRARLMAEVFDDGQPQLTDLVRVKFPTGGATSWTVVQGGEEKLVKELRGVIVLRTPQRVFWTDPDPKGVPPECMSTDAKVPLPGGLYSSTGLRAAKNPGGTCTTCPMTAWGSDLKGRAGQACKERDIVLLMTEGSLLPTMITVPPASLKKIKEFRISLLSEDVGYWGVEVAIGLKEAQSKDGQKYAEVALRVVRYLDEAEAAATEQYKDMMKDWVANTPPLVFVTTDDGEAVDGGVSLEDYTQ